MTRRRHMIAAAVDRRIAEIDALRLTRALTPAEQAEADNLTDRVYMRVWRAQMREQESIAAARANAIVLASMR